MVELSSNQKTPKSYRSFVEYVQDLQKNISSITKLLLGTGLVSDTITDIASTISSTYTLNSGTYTLSVRSTHPTSLAATYTTLPENSGILTDNKINSSGKTVLPFDQAAHVINGSTNNPVEVPYPRLTSSPYFAGYTVDTIGTAIYVNGTPQDASAISVVAKDAAQNKAKIAFSKIVGGAIYPDPIDKNGTLTPTVFMGTMSTWFSVFGDPIQLTFSNLDVQRTNRPLILELYDVNTNSYTYLNVFSSFQVDKPYYEVSGPDSIKVHIPAATQAAFSPSSTQMKLYFATTVSLNTATSNNNRFFRQYKLPIGDLLPDSSSLKIFSISKTTGKIKELVAESNALVGSLYSLDYITGFLSIYNIGGSVPEDETIAVIGYKYLPPVKPHNLAEYTNTISIYYSVGAVYEQTDVTSDTDLPNNLYLYLVPEAKLSGIESFLGAGGHLQTTAQVRLLKSELFVTTAPITTWTIPEFESFQALQVTPINLGTLIRAGYTYTFTPNPTADNPYDKLLALASTMPLITHSVFDTEKTTDTCTLTATEPLIIPIDYMHDNATEVTFFGLSGKLKVVDTDNPTTTKQYTLDLGYYDPVTDSFSTIQTLGNFDSGIDSGFIHITQSTFPINSIWTTTTPDNNKYLALQVSVSNQAGETNYTYMYDISAYINIKY